MPSPSLKTFGLDFFNTSSNHYDFAHLDGYILAMQRILLFVYWSSAKWVEILFISERWWGMKLWKPGPCHPAEQQQNTLK